MTEPNYAKEFHEATCEWRKNLYKNCENCPLKTLPVITYDNPRDILKRMRDFCGERQYDYFMDEISDRNCMNVYQEKYYINSKYILDPSALLKKAVEFLKGE